MFRCILSRVPVKSIVPPLKSVCKPRLHLLSAAPEFVKSRHHYSSSDPKNRGFFIEFNSGSSIFNIESGTNIDLPFPEPASNMESVGSCNGLICLGSFSYGRSGVTLPTTRGSVCLWNPAMKLFKLVSLSSPQEYFTSLGFGYDAELDDYKVVRLDFKGGIDRVEVYSVKSDSWTKIDPGFHFEVFEQRNDVIVNGNPYWVADDQKREDFLVCFDVKRMVFKTLPLTSTISFCDEHRALLVDWNGCVGAIVCALDKEEVVDSIDVWVFDDGEQIWKKNRSFEPPAEMKKSPWSNSWDLVGLKNGKILAMCHIGNKMWLFDYETGSFEEVCAPLSFEIFPYSESLVSFQGMEEEARMT